MDCRGESRFARRILHRGSVTGGHRVPPYDRRFDLNCGEISSKRIGSAGANPSTGASPSAGANPSAGASPCPTDFLFSLFSFLSPLYNTQKCHSDGSRNGINFFCLYLYLFFCFRIICNQVIEPYAFFDKHKAQHTLDDLQALHQCVHRHDRHSRKP